MDFNKLLDEIGLNSDNSVVIGSGILNALNIRKSGDIDVVVDVATYHELSKNDRFKKLQNHGYEILADEFFEIGISWGVLGKSQKINDLVKHSILIGSVRYITLAFLLTVKESWLQDDDVRQKDIDDIELIKSYLAK